MEKIQIPNTVLSKLQSIVNKEEATSPKPKGYSEVVRYLGLKYMSIGQARKLKTFFDNYTPSDAEEKEKYDMYGGNVLRNFVNNQLKSIETANRISNKVRRMTDHPTGTKNNNQTGRTVDRLTKPSIASIKPPDLSNFNQTQLTEEIKRILQLMSV